MIELMEDMSPTTLAIIAIIGFVINLGTLFWIIWNQLIIENQLRLDRVFYEAKIEAAIKVIALQRQADAAQKTGIDGGT